MPHFREVSASGTTEFLVLSLTRLFGLIHSVTFDSHEDLIDNIHAYHSTVKDSLCHVLLCVFPKSLFCHFSWRLLCWSGEC